MRKEGRKNIPHFKNLEEEARYWEKHSIAPYWDDLEDVDIQLTSPKLENWLLIKLDGKSMRKLNTLAHKKHKTIHRLAEQWVQSLAS